MMSASASAATPFSDVGTGEESGPRDIRLPPTYVLRTGHVADALKGVPDDVDDVTVWIHSSTLGIETECF
jgi:hypothetical protein